MFKEQLEKILENFYHEAGDWWDIHMEGVDVDPEAYDRDYDKCRETALTSIINLVDKELIGEDEPEEVEFDETTGKLTDLTLVIRNQLRAEQRAIIRGNE